MLNQEDFVGTLAFLKKSPEMVSELILYQFECELREVIRPEFFKQIEKYRQLDGIALVDGLAKAIQVLSTEVAKFHTGDTTIRNECFLRLKALMFHTIHNALLEVLFKYYRRTLLCYTQVQSADDVLMEANSDTCEACEKQTSKCICEALVERFRKLNQQIYELDLVDRFGGSVLQDIIKSAIAAKVKQSKPTFSSISNLTYLTEWLESYVFPWLGEIYGLNDENGSIINDNFAGSFKAQKSRMRHLLYDSYAHSLIEVLFNLIVEFPESEASINDLKTCLEYVNLRSHIITTLKQSIATRLLHPGVNTSEILVAYIQSIKALKVLDDTGVILDIVCEPIRQYLRQRNDTVRCIVTHLTESNADLSQELLKDESVAFNTSYDSDPEEDNWEDWTPEPIDSCPSSQASRLRKSVDVVSMLVGVYGSKEMFVKEYSSLLAERLLKNFNYEIEKEHRYLEMLKKRFGESELHQCEVMLKDVKDSHRIDTFVNSKSNVEAAAKVLHPTTSVQGLILSAQFWPSIKEEKLQVPQPVKNALDSYTKVYETLKASRTLEWRQHVGAAEVELDLNGRTATFNVSPILASIIWLFQEKESWSLEDLSARLSVPTATVRRRLRYWQNHGVVRENLQQKLWTLADSLPALHRDRRLSHGVIEADEEEMDSLMTEDTNKEEEVQLYWTYIAGVLANLESVTADRIHAMLRMFTSDGDEGFTLDQVQKFLERKVKEQQLIVVGGVYKLPKTNR